MDHRWADVDEYISGQLLEKDEVLEAALEASERAGLPPISVTAPQGKLLQLMARAMGVGGAGRILEIGTLGGYSTIWLARALPPGGSLVSLELEPKHAEVARANLARAGLAEVAEVRVGPAAGSLAQLSAEGAGPFDFIFIDADKPSYPEYFDWSLKLSRPGTVIIADNVVRNGHVVDADSPDLSVQGVRRFYERVRAEPRVTATAVQTVGGKNHDGFAMILVTA